jgi:hypothetical protein
MYRYGGSGSKNGKEHADSLHTLASLLGKSKLRCFLWISFGIEGVFQGLPLKISRLKSYLIYVRAWTCRYALTMGGIPQQLL